MLFLVAKNEAVYSFLVVKHFVLFLLIYMKQQEKEDNETLYK